VSPSVLMLEGHHGFCSSAGILCAFFTLQVLPRPFICRSHAGLEPHGVVMLYYAIDSRATVCSSPCLWDFTVEIASVLSNHNWCHSASHHSHKLGLPCVLAWLLDILQCVYNAAAGSDPPAPLLYSQQLHRMHEAEQMGKNNLMSVLCCLGRPAWVRLCRHALVVQLFCTCHVGPPLSAQKVAISAGGGGVCRPGLQAKVSSTVLLPVAISTARDYAVTDPCAEPCRFATAWGPAVHSLLPFRHAYVARLVACPLQAHATACVFLASKIDSVYHRLENIVHTAICELRRLQGRTMEPEYFNPDGVSNAAAGSSHGAPCHMVMGGHTR